MDEQLIEKAAEAIDAEWTRPEHGCDGNDDHCRVYCPYPAYQAMGLDDLRDAAARAVLEALDLPGLLNAAKAEAWAEGYVCGEDRAPWHRLNPYRVEEGNDRG